MTHDELTALEALEREASAAPWEADGSWIFSEAGAIGTDDDRVFIAAIRNAAPALIAAGRCEIEREARFSTHAPGCHTWGPRHYDCLMRRYEATCATLTQAQEALEPIVAGMEDDPDYGPTVRMSAISQENMTRARSALDAIRKVLRS